MPLTALADQTAATSYGYGTIDSGYFNRASARVRAFAESRLWSVDPQEYTVTVRGPVVVMPHRPVRSVSSVTDVELSDHYELHTDEYWVRAGGTLEAPNYGGNLEVVYDGGYDSLPDSVVEFVCQLASRMANTASAAASGVAQETGGSESVTFGFDSYSGISDLTTGELRTLGRLFPRTGSVVVLR